MGQGAQDRRREELLTTWKQIAAYLGVTVRTAQKWERERALPVHRVPGGRGRVWAKPAELDSWQRSADAAARESAGTGRNRRVRLLSFVAAAALVAAGLAVFRFSRPDGGEPASFRVQGDAFIVRDARGRELWRKPASDRLRWRAPERGLEMAWIGDVCGDSKKEVLLVATGSTEPMPVRLYCFTSSGAELWRFEPRRQVRTRDEVFGPPYTVRAFSVIPGEPRRIAVVSHHYLYFPSQVAILDGEGKVLSEYWHSGHIGAVVLADLDGDGESELYLGGTSNARNAATLLVFDPDRVSGASAESPPYQLLGFGPGTETARIFFPRTCVNRIVWRRNAVTGLRWSPPSLLIEVHEGERVEETVVYRFNARLELEDVEPSEAFLEAHRRFWQAGRIDHPWNPEEERSLRHITVIRTPGPEN